LQGQDPVRTTIAAAGTETAGLSNPGVRYVINTHESFTVYVMTTSSNAVRSVEHQPHVNEVPRNSAAYAIDFFEARHRLLTESERIAQESEVDREIRKPAIRRERFVSLVNALQEAFCWLILAAPLAYLAPGNFGL
jgi:hypothetical protein